MTLDQIREILKVNGLDASAWALFAGAPIDVRGQLSALERIGLTDSAILYLLGQYEGFQNLAEVEPLHVLSEEILVPQTQQIFLDVKAVVPGQHRRRFTEALNRVAIGPIRLRASRALDAEILLLDPLYCDVSVPPWIVKVVVAPLPYEDPVALVKAIQEAVIGILVMP